MIRRVRAAVLGAILAPGLLALPVIAPAAADPVPVRPSVVELPLAGVDRSELAGLPLQASPGTRTVTPAVLTPRRATDEFDLAGVTWQADAQPDGLTVQVRVREDGRWSGWELLEPADGGPDAGTKEYEQARDRTGTEPIVAFGADGIQVRVDSADGRAPAGLRADLVDAGESRADAVAEPAASAAAASAPPIITRAQWGADESLTDGPHRVNNDLKALFVHHTAGSNSYTREQAFAQLRGIYAYHTKTLGWDDIGYNLVIDRYGRTFEGRRGSITAAVRGAHAGGFNTDTYGVSVMGNFQDAAVPQAAVDAVAAATGWKLGQYGVDPRGTSLLVSQGGGTSRYRAGTPVRFANVSGHRDLGLTECPGDYLYTKLGAIRSRAATLAPGTARINWPAHPRAWDAGRQADVLAVDAGGPAAPVPGYGQRRVRRPSSDRQRLVRHEPGDRGRRPGRRPSAGSGRPPELVGRPVPLPRRRQGRVPPGTQGRWRLGEHDDPARAR